MQQQLNERNNAWTRFSRSLSAPLNDGNNFVSLFQQVDGDNNDTSALLLPWTSNATFNNNVTDLTVMEEITKRLQKIIMDEDGSFLYIPFIGAIYLALVFLVLLVTYCRHFAQVGDRRIRWIRHSTNSTCLTGPGTMTVICNNWVYLCRQHGHFGIAHKGATLGHHIRKMKITQTRRKQSRQVEMSVEDITIEQSNASLPSDQEQQGNNNNNNSNEQEVPMSDLPMRRTGSGCCPWTSYPTPTGVISHRELGEPARYRPETPAGQYYCVSGRHTPADEQIEFWDYTPELERRAAVLDILKNSATGGPGGSGGSAVTRTTNVSFATNLTSQHNPPSIPSSPGSALMPRASLTTPNLSVLTRATTSVTPHHHHPRRKSGARRQSSLKHSISHDEESAANEEHQKEDELNPRWDELTAAMIAAKPAFPSKPSSDQLDQLPGEATPRDRTSSAGSAKDRTDYLQMQQMRSYSPATLRRQALSNLAAQQAVTARTPQARPVDDDLGTTRRAGGILAITKIGREIRDKQSRFN